MNRKEMHAHESSANSSRSPTSEVYDHFLNRKARNESRRGAAMKMQSFISSVDSSRAQRPPRFMITFLTANRAMNRKEDPQRNACTRILCGIFALSAPSAVINHFLNRK
ncbi:MAG TPA: hypothetical protein PKM27_18920, partial [Saprospiraceae bacterium]|nr:hypothetical protein [Saprospiraceae bacterium]